VVNGELPSRSLDEDEQAVEHVDALDVYLQVANQLVSWVRAGLPVPISRLV
jgi:hypothetical protein